MWETTTNSIPVKHALYGTNAMREMSQKNTRKTYIKFMWPFGHMLGLVDEGHTPHQPSLARRVQCP